MLGYIFFHTVTPPPIHRGTGYWFRSISLFLCFFVSKITRKRLDRFAWNFQGRCGVTMGRPDYIFGQFRETARCRDAQHEGGVCCALASQLVCKCFYYLRQEVLWSDVFVGSLVRYFVRSVVSSQWVRFYVIRVQRGGLTTVALCQQSARAHNALAYCGLFCILYGYLCFNVLLIYFFKLDLRSQRSVRRLPRNFARWSKAAVVWSVDIRFSQPVKILKDKTDQNLTFLIPHLTLCVRSRPILPTIFTKTNDFPSI